MPPSLTFLASRWSPPVAVFRKRVVNAALIGLVNLIALVLMAWSEPDVTSRLVFCLTWGAFNFLALAFLRRVLVSAVLSLAIIVALVLLSRLKYEIVWTTASFLDVWIVNADAVDFLLSIKPNLLAEVLLALALVLSVLGLVW